MKTITDKQWEEYQRLLSAENYKEEMRAYAEKWEKDREDNWNKQVKDNIEQMKRDGTLIMGEM